jgi:hypothetical protein
MLTLKIVIKDEDDQVETYLFSGDSISHKEYFSTDHYLASKMKESNSTIWIVGRLIESSSNQKFITSNITIYDEDRYVKHVLCVVPKADCYIMDHGKTIDSFFCTFEIV